MKTKFLYPISFHNPVTMVKGAGVRAEAGLLSLCFLLLDKTGLITIATSGLIGLKEEASVKHSAQVLAISRCLISDRGHCYYYYTHVLSTLF